MMHPFLGVWGSPRNALPFTTTTLPNDVTITTSGTAYNDVTPVELVASTPFDVGYISLRLGTSNTVNGAAAMAAVDLMRGGSGSEYPVIQSWIITGAGVGTCLCLPLFVPSGERLSVRVRSSRLTTALTFSLGMFAAPPEVSWFPQRWIPYGAVDDASSAARGTIVVPGSTDAWGSWTELTASTTYAHDLWFPQVDGGSAGAKSATTNRTQFALASTTDAATMATNSTVFEGPQRGFTTGEAVFDPTFSTSASTASSLVCGLGSYGNGLLYTPSASGSAVSARAMCSGAPTTNSLGCSIMGAL